MISDSHKPLEPPVTICVLCYGNYPQIAQRILASLSLHTRREQFLLRIGLNAVSPATDRVLERMFLLSHWELLVRSETNLYKDPMMRRLFYDKPLQTEWTLWFDDDSYVFRDDWLDILRCESQLSPEVDMWGKKCFIRGDDKHREFIRASAWYRGLEPENDDRPGGCRISFAVGGFWAIRTIWLHRLDWPDRRLIQSGDDYIFGEALRQHGARVGTAFSGIAINQAPRRAPPQMPTCEVLR